MPAVELARLVRERAISPVELVRLYLARIETYDAPLNAFVTVAAEQALRDANAAEASLYRTAELPPFHGVPISIKDITVSSRAFADTVPAADSAVVQRVKDAGFIILGKTNLPELGAWPVTESALNGACRNPWNTALTPGGSSGGAAVAVTAGFCPVAQASDGAGSIRIPAACCGVIGLKPSRGRVPSVQRGIGDMVVDGAIARTVADAAALLDVLAGQEIDPFLAEVDRRPRAMRVGFTTRSPIGSPVAPECIAATEQTARQLAALGHDVAPAEPDWFDPSVVDSLLIVRQTIPAAMGNPDRSLLEPLTAALAAMAEATSSAALVGAMIALRNYASRVARFWRDYDLLLTPTLARAPIPVGSLLTGHDVRAVFARSAEFAPFPPVANLLGQPAISVPTASMHDGIPVAVQLIGALGAEAELIQVAAQMELSGAWTMRRPQLTEG